MPPRPELRNGLLSTLRPDDLELIAPHLEGMDLPRGKVLHRPDEPIGSVFFPASGIASVSLR